MSTDLIDRGEATPRVCVVIRTNPSGFFVLQSRICLRCELVALSGEIRIKTY